MSKKCVQDYDWAMYIDASGDDGFAFDRKSSYTYTVNSFMCETNKIEHNKQILSKVKAIVRCKPTDEIKSTTVIKSKKRDVICDTLSELDGVLFQFVIFKRSIDPTTIPKEDKEKHTFSAIAHGVTIDMAATFHQHYHKSLCIIVDNMKSEEIIGTKEMVAKNLTGIDYTIKFTDSKSAEHPLLQITDIFAGLTNRACKDHEVAISNNPSINRCMPCDFNKKLCKGKPQSIQTPLFYDIQRYVNLFSVWTGKNPNLVMGNGIRMFPINFVKRYRFFDCTLRSKTPKGAYEKR